MNTLALKIACKVVKNFEGCNLVSYADPASPLYGALTRNGMLQKSLKGEIKWKDLPDNFQALSGKPWTIGWGSTENITQDMVWTQQKADAELERHVAEFMEGAIKASPKLANMNPSQIAAVTSLCYNIGLNAYKNSTVARKIAEGDMHAAADAFLMWNKAGGSIMAGLVKRREVERNLFLSK